MLALRDQVAVITGASSGIGRAIALGLAGCGASLCLLGRDPAALQLVADVAKRKGAQCSCYQTNLEVDCEVQEVITNIKRDTKSVHILVHSAGAIWLDPIETADANRLDTHYKTNLRAPYVLTQGLLPALKSQRGQILFVNSSSGLVARANTGQYAASKHALKAVADSLREEVNPTGVRVMSLFLGRTATRMQADIYATEQRPYHPELLMQPDDVAFMAIQALNLPRTVEVTEIHMRPMHKSY
jgi:NADP-dependent 3-hydroxy acid dehydrogenase YdfG